MSEGIIHQSTPDDPNACRVIHAYEDTVMEEGAHASYEKHFAEDCFYYWYGKSPIAGRYEGIGGLKRFWDLLTELIVPEPLPVIELSGAGFYMYHVSVEMTAPDGEKLTVKLAGNYEVDGDKIKSGRFWVFEQDAFDAFLWRARAQLDQKNR